MATRRTKKVYTSLTEDELMILSPFLDFAEEGDMALARYMVHCGIDADDIKDAGDAQGAILRHYKLADGTYDVQAVAHDLARWPPIAARVKELKRQSCPSSGPAARSSRK
jgi:hypothetical protein